ncbi:MAG TPA: hypothetical protein VEP90_18460 [Methylomirabilota bacterium]|nr:hypothetical protein [Methylomirabilota bacterium]
MTKYKFKVKGRNSSSYVRILYRHSTDPQPLVLEVTGRTKNGKSYTERYNLTNYQGQKLHDDLKDHYRRRELDEMRSAEE